MDIVYKAIAAVISGGLSGLGFGAGTVLLLYFTIFTDTNQLKAQGINLLFFIPCALVALYFHFKSKLVKIKTALLTSSGGVLGVLLGVYLSASIDEAWLRKIFGGFLLLIAAREGFIAVKEIKKKRKKS